MANLFGDVYEEVGKSDANLLLNTRGKIKFRFGESFVDLLDSNGKLNLGLIDIQTLKSLLGIQET